jgi:hypothetical protein
LADLAKKNKDTGRIHFITVIGALTDAPSYTKMIEKNDFYGWQPGGVFTFKPPRDFTLFFTKIAESFSGAGNFLRGIKEGVQAITPSAGEFSGGEGIYSNPQVIFPGHVFSVPLADKEIVVLNKALVTKHQLEGRAFEINGKLALLLATSDIAIDLVIRPMVPRFISLIPGMATHTFKKIEVSHSMERFLEEAFFLIMKLNFPNGLLSTN